jgi:hypothetical protein
MWGTDFLRRTFDDLENFWDSLPKVDDSAQKIATPINSYTTYSHPQWLNDSTVIALKEDLDNTAAFVVTNTRTGHERIIKRVGRVSSRPAIGYGRVFWTEYRNSKVWQERVNSQLCFYDLAHKHKYSVASPHQVFFATPPTTTACVM